MDKREEFERELDHETEYGYDPNEILDEEPQNTTEEYSFLDDLTAKDASADSELEEILSDEFLASIGFAPVPEEEPTDDEEPAQPVDQPDDDVKEYKPQPAFEVEPEMDEEFQKAFEADFPSVVSDDPIDQNVVPVVEIDQTEKKDEAVVPPPRRRRKMSKERIIKEVYLPPIIIALTALLLVSFIGTAVGRTIKANKDREESIAASNEAASSALEQEANLLVSEAEVLAKGYDYDAAIAKLDSFSADKAQYQQIMDAYNAITQAQSQLTPIDDAASIPNLSFHCLIADPARAFTDEDWGDSFNANYVTIDEFSKILNQLYENGYVLVDFDSFIVETVGEDGKITYATQPIYLPADKKPIMLTETLVNYETFSIDGDGDGEADKDGAGFASKLVVRDGKIVNEYVNADGETVYGAYDLVPILEAFIEEHPDFCYRGARAILAVSGEDGVFGYRTMHSVKEDKGEDYYNEQVAGAKEIAAALREAGYTIACYTYGNVSYGQLSATKIQVDLDNWTKEVTPVLGEVPIMVYAKSSDISADGNYEGGNKYNVLKNEGFRYFISSASVPYAEVTVNYVRQSRIMVTGNLMMTSSKTFENYFDASEVLNDLRGD